MTDVKICYGTVYRKNQQGPYVDTIDLNEGAGKDVLRYSGMQAQCGCIES
jgi:hypothetical protein